MNEIEELKSRLAKAEGACVEMRGVLERFVAKVDAGLARSTETYNAAKHALSSDCGKDYIHKSENYQVLRPLGELKDQLK